MDTTVVLIPFPEQPTSESTGWSIARVSVPTKDVTALKTALSGRGVSYYPDVPDAAGSPRALLLLDRYDERWLEVVRGIATGVEPLPHDTYDFSWRLPAGPVSIGTKVQVVSSASAHDRQGNDDVIVFNPGLAFGDLRHVTTRLCTRAMMNLVDSGAPPSSLVDVGCGSGILFLIAARLGVKHLAATDISPYARYVARQNASLNGVSLSVSRDIPSERFDVVLANVWAVAFPDLAGPIQASLAEGGTAVISGFPSNEAESVIACFPELRFTPHEEDGWCALIGKRP